MIVVKDMRCTEGHNCSDRHDLSFNEQKKSHVLMYIQYFKEINIK